MTKEVNSSVQPPTTDNSSKDNETQQISAQSFQNKQVNESWSSSNWNLCFQDNIRIWNTKSLIGLLVISVIALTAKSSTISQLSEPRYVLLHDHFCKLRWMIRLDEVNFGKAVLAYLKREYFVDIHPPIGKLLPAAFAYIFGYNEFFEFGKTVLSSTDSPAPYDQIRVFIVICETLTVVAHLCNTSWDEIFEISIAALGSFLILFGNFTVWNSTHKASFFWKKDNGLRYTKQVHFIGFSTFAVLCDDLFLLGKIPIIHKEAVFIALVVLAFSYWTVYWSSGWNKVHRIVYCRYYRTLHALWHLGHGEPQKH